MPGLTHPVGDQPANVYWKRRLAVVVAVVVAALLVWWLFSAIGGGSADPATPPDTTNSPGVTNSPDETAAADLDRACTSDDITLVTEPTKDSFSGNTEPTFVVTATQVGDTPCKLDTGADGSAMLITSGDDRIYSSTDCTDDATFTDKEYLLQPDDTQEIDITWDRTRSEKGCKDVSAVPGDGTYKIKVTIGDIAAKTVPFELT